MRPLILIADDSPAIQKVLKIAVARLDVTLEYANNFAECQKFLADKRPQLIFFDSALPGYHNINELQSMLNLCGNPSLVLLVGSYENFDEGVLSGLQNKSQIMRKPFAAEDLLKVIHPHLTQGSKAQLSAASSAVPPLPSTSPNKGRLAFDHEATETSKNPVMKELDVLLAEQVAEKMAKKIDASGPLAAGHLAALTDRNAAAQISAAELHNFLESHVKFQLPALVKAAVEEYCKNHYKEIAREVIAAELKRLSDERTRLLSQS
ncbi:MAG: hypothetical protein KBD78_12930 [Oligoflexales bacterium]|nr:hypothetical protein [Oligoflexales bacterium]